MRLLLFLLLILANFVYSQNPYAIKYSIDEGLPTSNIYAVFEDSKGYVWFGTDVGALKFDGYNFEHFSTDNGLSDNEVFKFYEDSKHRIWFITLNGKLSFYQNGRFENTNTNQLLKAASNSKMITDIFEFEGMIHILYREGRIIKLDMELNNFESSTLGSSLFGYWIKDKQLFYLTIENIVDSHNKEVHSIKDKRDSSLGYRAILHDGEFVFSIKGELFAFDSSGVYRILTLENEDIIHLSSIEGKLFIGTRTGFYIKSKSDVKKYFISDAVSYIDKDSQGNFWITTLNDGIKFVPNFNISHYKFDLDKIKVNALKKDKRNVLWIGTGDGLYTLNSKNSIKKITDNNYINKIRHYENSIYAVGQKKISIIDNTSMKTLNFGANDFYFDAKKYLFSSSVVFKFSPTNLFDFPQIRQKNTVNSRVLNKYKIFKKRTNVIKKFEYGSVLFGTSLGLYCYSKDSIYQVNPLSDELNSTILDIYYNKNSKDLIIATNSKGVSILKNDSIINHFTKKQGLSSNTCYAIKPFKNDFLIATNKGLDRLVFKNNAYVVESLYRLLGVKNEKVNDVEVVEDTIYIATDKGMFSFILDDIISNETKPKMIIEKVLVNGLESVNLKKLSNKENNLSVAFIGLSYKDYGNLDYEFKLNDEKKWTKTTSRQIQFKNLPHGTYNLEIRTLDNSNNYSSIKTVSFKILPPFWKTLPFIIVTALFFCLFVYTLFKHRLKKQKQKFELERIAFQVKQEKIELEKLTVQLEQKALRMQMNPHFIFNALNTIKGYYSGGNIDEANSYISRFSKLLRLILENDEHLVSLEKEVEMLELYIKLIQLRYQNSFDYAISVSSNIRVSDIGIPPLLLQPMVENAIIHGIAPSDKKGSIKIHFALDKSKLICTVIDNGIGIDKTSLEQKTHHKSKALHITKERIQLINDSDNPDNFIITGNMDETGTKIIIKLPILKLW